jgi:ferredoxin
LSVRVATITFFSGTGNTRHACALLAAGLERAGWRVELREIAPPRAAREGGGAASGTGARRPDLVVFAFPVFALGLPHIVRAYLGHLPHADHVPAAVLAVYGDVYVGPPGARRRAPGFEGGTIGEARRLLARRGHEVRSGCAVGFPASITQVWPPPDESEQRLLLADSEEAIAAIAADFAAGKPWLQSRRPVLHVVGLIFRTAFSLLGRRALGKMYVADERCTSCGWCGRACPARTIRLRGARVGHAGARLRRLPRWGWRCEACQRCINGCPEASIQVSVFRILALLAVAALPWARWLAAAVPGLAFPGSRILAWLVGTLLATVTVDLLLRPLERVSGVRRILFASYTRKFRRYPGPTGD